MKQVLVVCTANVCRSPLVAALLQQRVTAAHLEQHVSVESAGVRAVPGHAVDPVIVAMLDEMGADLARDFAAPVVEAALRQADLVLVMEEAHRQALFYRLPNALPKIFLLSEMAGRNEDIDDPHGGPNAVYAEVLATVSQMLEVGWPRILSRLGIKTPPA